ncbi:hypothetical protein [Streptomyces scabiei]|uniref:hypothetical protein n=1 Tax=Streptomyces scabiei TaxID=1930 RepID=UPI0007659674|nr:hypothetical protein [Streptomyces scabiei]
MPDSVPVNRPYEPRILSNVSGCLGVDLRCVLPHDDYRQLPDAERHIVCDDSDPLVEGHARMVLAERTGTVSLLAMERDDRP